MRACFLLLCTVLFLSSSGADLAASPLVVNPDGSVPEGEQPPEADEEAYVGALAQGNTMTIDFNELASGEFIAPTRYSDRGVIVEVVGGQGSVRGSVIAGPCDGTRSLQKAPFSGAPFLLRFPEGTTHVALDVGDFGPSDSDEITLQAFGDDMLTTVVGTATAFFPQGHATGCARLAVDAATIKAVMVSSVSQLRNASGFIQFFPNSILIDNLTFTPANLKLLAGTGSDPSAPGTEMTTVAGEVIRASIPLG